MATTQIRGSTQIIGLTIIDAQIAAAAAIQTSKLQDGTLFIKSDGSVVMGASLNLNTHTITNVTDPVNPQDAATRAWVLANAAGGVVSSTSVRVATVGTNLTLSGTQTIDGIALVAGNTILVKDQTSVPTNGLYTVAAGAWTRLAAMDTWAEVPGMIVSVQEGTTNHDTIWLSIADAGGTLGTTNITFAQIPGPSDITAGAGLLRTGQVIDVVSADNTMTINADSLQVKLDAARAVTVGASGIGVNIDAATLQISANQLGVKAGTYLGANTTYTLAATPIVGTEEVFLNGILQEPGAGNDYTIATSTITMLSAPLTGDRLRVNYRK